MEIARASSGPFVHSRIFFAQYILQIDEIKKQDLILLELQTIYMIMFAVSEQARNNLESIKQSYITV